MKKSTLIPEEKVWLAGDYSRLSREDGDKEESDSIRNQKELIRSYVANRPDIQLAASYEDDGYTGVNFDRPSFKSMIEDIKAGKINCVIVKDLSRFGRNYIEMGKLLERFFPFMGVRFIAVNDSYDSMNHNAQTDDLIIPFKNLINDAYCADISKKVRSQFDVRRKNGDFMGAFAVYGYAKDPEQKNHLVIDDETAPVVRDIYAWKVAGMSQQGIADKLNSLGIPSPLEYKKRCGSKFTSTFDTNALAKWTPVAVGRVLKNEVYTGVLTQGIESTPNYKTKHRVKKPESEWARVEGTHDAIISAEDFRLVKRLLGQDTRIKPGGTEVYLFSGLLYCGDCNRALVRKPVKGSDYSYFVCSSYKKDKGSCQSHNISESKIYTAVYEVLTHHIQRCAEIERLMSFIEGMPLRRAEALNLQRQVTVKQEDIERISRRKVRLYEDYADGVMDKAEYERFKSVFDMQFADANKDLEALGMELNRIASSSSTKVLWIEQFKKHLAMERLTRPAVAELVDRIEVYEGKRLEVRIRYYDEFEAAITYLESLPDNYMERMAG
jgi:DNA invertase Pin-like site-specific DNA recombinase